MRIGILGAANIAAAALVKPASRVDGVECVAVAARDGNRAREYARRHAIPTAYDSYEALLADGTIDAVYIPLPNGLHGTWTMHAIEAGKHVLCEKPFTANADEAREVAAVAATSGHRASRESSTTPDRPTRPDSATPPERAITPDLVVMEAFHYRYHPLSQRILDILASGELGTIESVDATLCVPMPPSRRNIRWNYDLAGGSMMDLGCYGVHLVRTFAGAEPVVTAATARVVDGTLDRFLNARLAFPDGVVGSVTVAMWSARLFALRLDIRGTHARMRVSRPISPQFFAHIALHTRKGRRLERTTHRPSYEFQLEAFRDAVGGAATNLTPPPDSVANMAVIDAAYQAAGLTLRRPTPP